MRHLKLFESHNKFEKIKEELENYHLELLDLGYKSGFSHNDAYSITVFNLYKKQINFNFPEKWSDLEWQRDLKLDTIKVASIQKRLLNLETDNLISKVQFHVYTYYDYPNRKSTLQPGLIGYSSILNGETIYRDMTNKLIELRMDMEDLEDNGMIIKPVKYYYDIQIQQEIDYGTKDAASVLFKKSF